MKTTTKKSIDALFTSLSEREKGADGICCSQDGWDVFPGNWDFLGEEEETDPEDKPKKDEEGDLQMEREDWMSSYL